MNKDGMGNSNNMGRLERNFDLSAAIMMSAGLVIGVGLFTVSTNAAGYLGPSLLLGNFVALIIALLTSLVYAELAAMYPFTGGSYVYAYETWGKLGPFFGFLIACTVIGGYFAVGAEALAFANYFLSTIDYISIWNIMVSGEAPYTVAAAIASILILIYTIINWHKTSNVALSQKVIMLSMWGAAFVSILIVTFTSLDVKNYQDFFPKDLDGSTFIMALTLIWWAYAGQEVIGTMAEEIRFPTITIPRALILVPFVIFAVTTTLQWVIIGIIPDITVLQNASAPFALALEIAGVGTVTFLLFMLAEFMGNFSTVNPLLTGSSRIYYALGKNGYLPKALGKLSKRNTPALAVWIAGLSAILLLLTNNLLLIAQYTAFMFLFLYGFIAITHMVARYTRKDVARPFKTPLFPIIPLLVLGFVIWMMTSLPKEVIIGGIVWLAGAAVFYVIWTRLPFGKEERKNSDFFKHEAKEIHLPTPEEKIMLDKEFKRFAIRLGIVLIMCVLFYLVTYLMGK